ncbi:Mucin-13 [Varicellaria rhodocarpa]|nr:Mucin-13 [Varicellaria rhodocarpa]
MKASTTIALLPLVGFAAAVPLPKRDLVWFTVTQQVIKTVDVITTVWLPGGGSEVTSTPVTTTLATEEPVTATPSSIQTPISSAAVTSAAPISPSEPAATSLVVSSASSDPPPYTTPARAPVSTTPSTTIPAAGSAVTGSFLPGATVSDLCTLDQPCVGKITFYNVAQGTGACGEMHQNTELVVAVAAGMMGSLSSGTDRNPLCDRTISITDPSTKITQTATVVDKCPGCTGKGLDLSPALFDMFYPETKGFADNIEWHWTS